MEKECNPHVCKFCGWDPDGDYCVNKDVIAIRIKEPGAYKEYPFGLALERAEPICNQAVTTPGEKLAFFEPKKK